jgi:oligogalacturonide lyase
MRPAVLLASIAAFCAAQEPPVEWIEPVTGHRVARLSREPGSASFYFHQNGFAGGKLVFSTRSGLATVNLKTREIAPLVEGRASNVIVGRKTRQAFYMKDGAVWATHVDTGATREITKFPPDMRGGSGFALNADETLLGGSAMRGPASERPPVPAPKPGESRLEPRFNARLPMQLYTINVKTGAIYTFHPSNDWLNHVQFSPSDPHLMMFCHEGPWHKLDRIWTIPVNVAGAQPRLMHKRTMEMEIAGHEFFGHDGKVIWYDLQTPKYKVFWLAGVEIATGRQIRYSIEREHWSVHFNVSPDGKLFAGDGGGPRSVAAPGNGQWIYLFTPRDGKLMVERLVDLSKHDYTLEPNVSFTPDGRWIVFRSNLHGASHVYAVEVAKR